MAGDRLLVAVTTRPQEHPAWPQWTTAPRQLVQVSLTGLSLEHAAALVRHRWPSVSPGTAQTLWRHTGGNPRYLLALLAEAEPEEIRQARVLPAPAGFARAIAARTASLDAAALTLLRAIAVLDSTWVSLPQAASVAGIRSAAGATQRLADRGLIRLHAGDGPVSVRTSQSLLRSAVYQQTPLPVRRALHGRAAQVVTGRRTALLHRVASAEQYDEPLAAALEVAADEAYERRSFRQSAEYLRWASALTAEPRARERRGLDSLFSCVMAFDLDDVHRVASELARVEDTTRRDLVLGALALWELRRRDAIGLLKSALACLPGLPLDTIATGDRVGDGHGHGRIRYRLNVLLAFAELMCGHSTEKITRHVRRAEATGQSDVGLAALHLLTAGQMTVRRRGPKAALSDLGALPVRAAMVPMPASGLLAWRGSLRARFGLTAEAAADLTEVTRRVQSGVSTLGMGAFHALLGYTHWLRGEWGLARTVFRLAQDLGGPVPQTLAAAAVPLADIGVGRLADADAAIGRAYAQLADAPWAEGLDLLLMTQIVRAHAGSAEDRRELRPLRGPAPLEVAGRPGYSTVTLMHVVQAQVWAGDLDRAEDGVARLAYAPLAAAWVPAAVHWLRGLIYEAYGDDDEALTELRAADRNAVGEMPFYQAHMLTDLSRVAERLGHSGAGPARDHARQIYQRLGAVSYLGRLAAVPPPRTAEPEAEPQDTGPAGFAPAVRPLPAPVTDRERDVLTLLLKGLSYAQISRELSITRSTVGYHLGNLYAKTGVTSRHQLTELARTNPRAFTVARS